MVEMSIIIQICNFIGIIIAILCCYKVCFYLIGIFKYRKFKPTKNKHNYAFCIPARNESKVIKNLLDSIANQDYPLEKITVFVVADNCTDETAQIARSYDNGLNVVVYEHNNTNERTKGFALRYLFEQIKNDYEAGGGVKSFDGYFVFDADNVLSRNYVTKMNEAFDAGNKIITSCRLSKNMNQNWISFSYATHWLRTCLGENRGKSVLKQACRIQGTGFLFSNELVRNGWIYTSLTEDRSFCTDAVIQNYKISYCDEAVFYDEQPYKLKIALRQRLRWAKGHLQSAIENCPKLMCNMINPKKNFCIAYDCFWLNFPKAIESVCRSLIVLTMEIIIAILTSNFCGWFLAFVMGWIVSRFISWLSQIFIYVIPVLIVYRKKIGKLPFFKTLFNAFMFPFFDVIGRWSMYFAVFKKVEWKPIPHDTIMDIEDLNKN